MIIRKLRTEKIFSDLTGAFFIPTNAMIISKLLSRVVKSVTSASNILTSPFLLGSCAVFPLLGNRLSIVLISIDSY